VKKIFILALVLFFSVYPGNASQVPKPNEFVVPIFCVNGGYNFGNGVVINAEKKYIFTVAHIILESAEIFVALPKGDRAMLYPASIVWVDRRQDAAILQLNDAAPQLVSAPILTNYPVVGSSAKIFGFKEKNGELAIVESKFTVWHPSMILPNGQEKARILLSAKSVGSLDNPAGLSGCPLLNEESRVAGIQKGRWGEIYLFVPVGVIPEKFLK
jgi:hypothetical protein